MGSGPPPPPPPNAGPLPELSEEELGQAVPVNPPATPGVHKEKRFPCGSCGADVVYSPGAAAMKCPYCGFENAVPQSADDILELDYNEHLLKLAERQPEQRTEIVKCGVCAAETTVPLHITSLICPFCGSAIVATDTRADSLIRPQAVLPFAFDKTRARQLYRRWLSSLWFAPGKLKAQTLTDDRFTGLYVPYWTYDCKATSWYQGYRGDDYWVTESVMVNSRRQQRQVRKTRWTPASGVVWNGFDDVVVMASRSLPADYAQSLEPWDLHDLQPYQDEYLSGFRSERYQVELQDGFQGAQAIMQRSIAASVRADIGGNRQRITEIQSQYDDITFKHILLPVWLSTYRYHSKTYRFLVNARTGKVIGERPYSGWKIFFAVASALLLILIVILIAR